MKIPNEVFLTLITILIILILVLIHQGCQENIIVRNF